MIQLIVILSLLSTVLGQSFSHECFTQFYSPHARFSTGATLKLKANSHISFLVHSNYEYIFNHTNIPKGSVDGNTDINNIVGFLKNEIIQPFETLKLCQDNEDVSCEGYSNGQFSIKYHDVNEDDKLVLANNIFNIYLNPDQVSEIKLPPSSPYCILLYDYDNDNSNMDSGENSASRIEYYQSLDYKKFRMLELLVPAGPTLLFEIGLLIFLNKKILEIRKDDINSNPFRFLKIILNLDILLNIVDSFVIPYFNSNSFSFKKIEIWSEIFSISINFFIISSIYQFITYNKVYTPLDVLKQWDIQFFKQNRIFSGLSLTVIICLINYFINESTYNFFVIEFLGLISIAYLYFCSQIGERMVSNQGHKPYAKRLKYCRIFIFPLAIGYKIIGGFISYLVYFVALLTLNSRTTTGDQKIEMFSMINNTINYSLTDAIFDIINKNYYYFIPLLSVVFLQIWSSILTDSYNPQKNDVSTTSEQIELYEIN